MTPVEVETMLDLRLTRKRLWRWRIFAGIAVVAAIAIALAQMPDFTRSRDHIARIRIDGVITGDQRTLDLLDDIAKAEKVKAVIVHIDSPGGTTVGSEVIYDKLRKIAETRPVVGVMDNVAASGGYITALATDRIYARGNTVTGSIGVIFAVPEFSGLMEKIGVRMQEVKSSDLKAEPNPYKPMSEKVRAVTEQMVQESYVWFTGLVEQRRKMSAEKVKVLADGRVYSGREAVKNGLIDELGSEETAVAWLKSEKSLSDKLDVVEWERSSEKSNSLLGFSLGKSLLHSMGLEALAEQVNATRLDGLLVLWHP